MNTPSILQDEGGADLVVPPAFATCANALSTRSLLLVDNGLPPVLLRHAC